MTKSCSQCKIVQNLTEFHQYKSGPRIGKYWSQCKNCRYKQLKEWRKKNPEKYKKNYKKGMYSWLYGLEVGDVKTFGICPICEEEKKLVVDHDHSKPKGTYRGFLCNGCNILLGHIENSIKMSKVKQYLNKDYL